MSDFIGLDPDVDYEREYELKLHEIEDLKRNYDHYVETSKEYERELDAQLKQGEIRNQELERRLQVADTKYRSLQDNYDRISRDFTNTITHLQSVQSAFVIVEDNNRKLEVENEDLHNHIRILEATETDLNQKLNTAQEEIILLKNDVESLQEAKSSVENSLSAEIMTLKEDVKRGINRRRRSLVKPDFGMDSLDFNTQESELQAQTQENLELTVRELATLITDLETENADLQAQLFQAQKRLTNGVIDRTLSLDPVDEVQVLKDEIDALREILSQKDNEIAELSHLQELIEEKDERLRLIEKEFMEMLTPTFKAAKADAFYRMVPSSFKSNGSFLQIDSTTSVMGRLKSFLGTDDPEKLKKELIKMVGKYEAERSRSVQLLHKIQTLQGNIIACCRTRPPSDQELAAGGKTIVDTMDDTELMFYDGRLDTWKSFAFDRVWKADKNQVDVFADIEPVVISVAEGYNACIIAYGQTGSGKTYTMDGNGEQYGISYRTIQKLFEILETTKSNRTGSNKNLLALAAKSSRDTPKTSNRKELAPKSQFEYVNPMAANSRRSSRATSSSPADRYSIAASSPAQEHSETASEHLDLGIAALHVDSGSERSHPVGLGSDSIDLSDRVEVLSDDVSEDGESSFNYTLEISMLEIYNEQVFDLLNENFGGGQTDGISLDLRLTQENVVVVPGLRQLKVNDMDEVESVFSRGAKNRATSATNLNANSSRSHLITIVEVTVEESDGTMTKGKLFLVDLAGSERVEKSGAKGQVMKEAQFINKSLSALGDVMEALDQKQKHIPFRNSKLTYLLQNALGGNAKTVMIFTVCPTDLSSEETQFTLQFAQRVRNITLTTAQRNISAKNLEISVKMLKSELREVKKKKIALEELLVELKKDAKKAVEKNAAPLEMKIRTLEEQKKLQEINYQSLQKQLQDAMHRVDEEKVAKQQTLFDLELTQRNLKRALEVSKEYTLENERLMNLVKQKEQELEGLKDAVTQTILSPKRSPTAGNLTNGASSASPRVHRSSFIGEMSPVVVHKENSFLPPPIVTSAMENTSSSTQETSHEHNNGSTKTSTLEKIFPQETEDGYDPQENYHQPPPQNHINPDLSQISSKNISPAAKGMSPLTKRLSPAASTRRVTAKEALVTTNSVTSILGELEVESAVMDSVKTKKDLSSVTPKTTHTKVHYQRKAPIPRQSSLNGSTDSLERGLRRSNSFDSVGSHNSRVSRTATTSVSSRSSISIRNQEALKKHQQRMEARNLASAQKGRIY